MILELSLESLFAIVDIFFVGRLGENAIAVVGYTEAMITIIYSIAIGLSTAATAVISRRIGEKSPAEASVAAGQAILIAAIFTILISVPGYFFAKHLLGFMGASEQVILDGTPFTKIMFGSSGVIVFLFLINGIFRGAGNATIAMHSLWIASILNIVLDPLLIYGIGGWAGFGLKGAAIATCIGRGMGVLYQCNILFRGGSIIRLNFRHFLPDKKVIIGMINLAWPATFQFIVASGSWIILTRLVAETGGTTASAAYQVAIRNVVFFILPAWGLSNAAATLVGQNLGAGKIDRAEQSVLLCIRYNTIFMAVVSLTFLLLATPITAFFSNDPEVIEIGTMALRIIGGGFVFYGIGMVLMQSLNGAGDTQTPTVINVIGFWCFQVPMAYFFTKYLNLGVWSIFAAVPVAESLVGLLAWFAFRKGRWKNIEV